MSVINNVLKDLETRESRFTPLEIDAVEAGGESTRNLRPILLTGFFLLSLMAVAWVYLQDQLLTNAILPAPAMANVTFETTAVLNPIVTEKAPEPGVVTDQMIGNQIIGMQIRESEQDMRIEFALREKVVAYLKERGENNFSYHLRDIESQIVAPLINDNRWVRELSIVATESGVDISFQTVAEILVETRQNQVDEETVWAISLRKYEVEEVAVASTQNSPATVPAEVESGSEAVVVASLALPAETLTPLTEPAVNNVSESSEVKIDIKSTNPDTDSDNQLEYAIELVNSRRLNEAEALLQSLLTGVQDYRARQHLLVLYGHQNRAERLRRLLRESIAAYPDDSLFKSEYARALYQAGAYRMVIQLFADSQVADATQQALIAASYQRLDEHENAVIHYRLALKQDSGNAKNWVGLGISQEHSSAFADALNSYQKAARLGQLNSRLQAFVDKRSKTLKAVLN